jgi:hypothetical protein
MTRRRCLVPLLALIAVPAVRAAEIRAVRVESPPRIDGLLNDPAWSAALPFSAFRTAEPLPDGVPSERTELRVLSDGDNLYLGVFCADREPERIAARTMAHDSGAEEAHGYWRGGDQGLPSDDLVRVLLDPFQDKRKAYVFFVNPRGARGEGLAAEGRSSLNWDGIWDAAGRIVEDG